MCLGGWGEDYGVNVEVTEEVESIKCHVSYCIILTVQHLTDAFIQSDTKTTVCAYVIYEHEGSSRGNAEAAPLLVSVHEPIK